MIYSKTANSMFASSQKELEKPSLEVAPTTLRLVLLT